MFVHALSVITLSVQTVAAEVPAPQDSIRAQAAREDILQLGDLLERVHPDPFEGFGGRVAYSRAFQSLVDDLPDGWVHVADLRRRIGRFLGDMGDGHTGLSLASGTSGGGEQRYLPVRLTTSSDGIVISDALGAHQDLLGARVDSVEGRSVDDLARATRVFRPSENLPGSRRQLARSLEGVHLVREILPDVGRRLRLTVTRPGAGGPEEVTLAYERSADDWRAGPWPMAQVDRVGPDVGPFNHRMIADGRVGYLRLRAMWSREAFESMRAAGRTDLDQWLTYAYDRYMDGPKPPDVVEGIDAFPSLIDEVDALLRSMREHDARDVIVDLRANGGGFSVIGEPLLYQLFGDAYLRAPDPVFFATRVSAELLSIRGKTLADLSREEGREVRLGDFTFDPSSTAAGEGVEEFLQRLRDKGFSRVDALAGVAQEPGLHVVALTDAATFSAAFDLTYHLHRMGAVLVGVSPSQSPRAFTDATPFVLTNSGLGGSMSRTAVVYPGIPSEDGAVVLDLPLTWARWAEHGFHPDAAVQMAVELLRRR
ncbi:MAG: S41 family peptidase [Gemmatimonadota bacterium]